MTDAAEAREIADSLLRGDHIGLTKSSLRGFIGMAALVRGCVRSTGPDPAGALVFIVANPVAHGARLGSAVALVLPANSCVVADRRLATESLDVDADFASLATRSIGKLTTWRRLTAAIRMRVALRSRPHGRGVYGEYLFLAQAVRYRAAQDALKRHRPDLVLVDYEHHAYAKPWMHAARRAGVRTATLVHGTPNEWNYLPVLADHVFAWGRVQEDWFKQNSAAAMIHVVGRPDVDAKSVKRSSVPRFVLSNSAEKLSQTELERILRRIGDATQQGFKTVLRLHPSVPEASLDERWRQISDSVDLTVVGDGALSADLGENDVVAVIASSSAIDAIASGARAEVLADWDRRIPADLFALAKAGKQGLPFRSTDYVLAIGDESRTLLANAVRVALESPVGHQRLTDGA